MSKIELPDELIKLVNKTETLLYQDEGYAVKKKIKSSNLVVNEISFDNLSIAKFIDHTLLKPDALPSEIIKLCYEAKENRFASVCVNPSYVKLCSDLLKNSGVKVCTVIGFPLGSSTTGSKKFEAEEALQNGADEIDMVINIGQLKAKVFNYVFEDIKAVADSAKKYHALSKVIIETCLLTDEEKIIACLISRDAGADFVKTSTGFSKGGAAVQDVVLVKYVVGPEMKVKASGGIRSREDAIAMLENGADRLGTSSGVKIITGEKSGSSR